MALRDNGDDPIVPVAMEIGVTIAARQSDFDEGQLWDKVDELLRPYGFLGEGGSARIMDEADVIPNSPLAKDLAELRATTTNQKQSPEENR